MNDIKHPEITVRLVGADGNAFMVLGKVRREMRHGGVSDADIRKFTEEATTGDYDHLLQTVMEWVTVE